MANRGKVLVVHSDLDTVSRIYLALVHRKYKAEASNRSEEISERLKRMKPALIILGKKEFLEMHERLKIPAIILLEKEEMKTFPLEDEFRGIEKPVQIERLMHAIEELMY